MEYQKIVDICMAHNNGYLAKYRIEYKNGRKEVRKLWLADNKTSVCILGKRKRNMGHYLGWESYDIVSVTPIVVRDVDRAKLFLQRARKASQMLSESGLWPDIKVAIDKFLSMDKEAQNELMNDIFNDSYELFYKQSYGNGKYNWVASHQVFCSFASKKCWQSVPWGWRRDCEAPLLAEAIRERKDFHCRWTNGYDNDVEVKLGEDGVMRGWLSLEYRGCANGHYYLLFDATHAIYYEDD